MKHCHKKELKELLKIKEIFSPENIVKLVCYTRTIFIKQENVYDNTYLNHLNSKYSRIANKNSVLLQPQDLFFPRGNISWPKSQYQEAQEHIRKIQRESVNNKGYTYEDDLTISNIVEKRGKRFWMCVFVVVIALCITYIIIFRQ